MMRSLHLAIQMVVTQKRFQVVAGGAEVLVPPLALALLGTEALDRQKERLTTMALPTRIRYRL